MRFAAIALCLSAACGRIDFDPDRTSPPPDSGEGPSTRSLCDVVKLGDMPGLAGAPTAIRVVATGGGHAILVGTDAGNIYAVRMSATFAIQSVHLPLQGGYALRGAGDVGGNVFLQTDLGADAYLKRLDPSWETYGTMDQGTPALVDPPVALLGASAIQGIVQTDQVRVRQIDAIGNELLVLPARRGIAASLTEAAVGVLIATDNGDGTCSVASSDNTVALSMDLTACADPTYVRGTGGTLMLHRDPVAGGIAIRKLPDGATIALPRTAASAAQIDGALWVASASTGATMIGELVGDTLLEGPIAVPVPFDLTPAGLVWIDGTTLRRGMPCRD